jgi:hypothetical protein
LYARAQHLFDVQKQRSKALYAEVSQVPPDESGSVPGKIFHLTQDLGRPAAQEAETRLNEHQAQDVLHACLAQQMTIQNMQQRSAAAQDLNTWGFVQAQHTANPTPTLPIPVRAHHGWKHAAPEPRSSQPIPRQLLQ